MSRPTNEQIKRIIADKQKRGETSEQIQGWLDGLGTAKSLASQVENIPMRRPPKKKGVFSRIVDKGLDIGAATGDFFGRTTIGLATGALKGAASTVRGVEEVGIKIGEAGRRGLRGETKEQAEAVSQATREAIGIEKEEVAPEGIAQKIGFGVEQFAELLIPVGSAYGLTSKVAVNTTKISKTLQGLGISAKIAEGAAKVMQAGVTIGGRAVAEGVDVAAKRTIQTGGDTEQAKEEGKAAFVTTAVLGTLFAAGGVLFKSLRKSIERSNLKLTVGQKTNLEKKINKATDYLKDNPVTVAGKGTDRLAEMNSRVSKFEGEIQAGLEKTKASAPKFQVRSKFEAIKETFRGTAQFDEAGAEVDKIIQAFLNSFDDVDNISLSELNKFKRSLWEKGFNKAGLEVADEVSYEAGRVLKELMDTKATSEGIQFGAKPLNEFLSEYSTVLNARNFVKASSGRSEVGLAMKLLLSGTAGLATGGPGILAGSLIQGTGAITRVRSALAFALKGLEDTASLEAIGATIRAVLAAQSVSDAGKEEE